MLDYKVGESAAREEMDKFCEYYDIVIDDIKDIPARNATLQAKEKIVKAIRRGLIEIIVTSEDDIHVKQTLIKPPANIDHMLYGVLGARNKDAMERGENKGAHSRLYSLAGSLTGLGKDAVLKLKAVDLSIMENLAILFLAT